jgi:cell division protein FtsL
MKVIANAFLILAAGAAAYFSYDQSQKFQAQQDIRLETKAEEAKTSAEADGATKEYKDSQAALAESTRKRDEVLQGITALKAAETSLKRDIAAKDTELATQKEELAELDKAVEELNKFVTELGGGVSIDNIGDKIVEVEKGVKDKTAKMDELTTLIDGAQKKIAATRAESKRLSDRAVESAVRVSRNATEAVVTAVNQDWGFLVIGAGSNSGFTPQSSLLVKRDGKLIARVRPTTVEATQTIADIDLDSLAPGVRIQPGDRVILATPAAN